jgi:hypothetical protein
MKMKKWFAVVFLSVGITAFAQTEGDFTVALTEDNAGVVITRYNGNLAAVRIPATIQGMPVREIGEQSFFKNLTITSVVIPEGVTAIRNGRQNFGPFAGCDKLVSVTFPLSLKIIGKRAFAACTSLRAIVIPEGVTEIGDDAFAGCRSLASITLPNTLTRLGDSAFSVEFEILGVSAGLKSAPVFISIILPKSLTIIDKSTFSGVKTLTSIVIPEGVTEIREGAFDGCTALVSVTIPSTIKSIGSGSFRNCTALTTVTIPDSVENIEFESGGYGGSFGGNGKLNLASQAALKRRGYTGNF